MNELLDEITSFLEEEFIAFNHLFEEALKPQLPYIKPDQLALYQGGKKLRPILLLLVAHLNNSSSAKLPEKVIQSAVSLEMMHVATLIHDDIVDDAPLRRGTITTNANEGIKRAVLMGDMQFIQAVRGFLKAIESPEDLEIVRRVMDVGFQICAGELDELEEKKEKEWKKLEERYLKTIDRKTAQLFGISCETGAYLMNASKKSCYYASQFGRLFGISFQITDDILDFLSPSDISGKVDAIDLLRGRLTFPIILALQEFPSHHIIHKCTDETSPPLSVYEVQKLAKEIAQSNSIITSYTKAKEYMLEAKEFLKFYPKSIYKSYLENISDTLIESLDSNKQISKY